MLKMILFYPILVNKTNLIVLFKKPISIINKINLKINGLCI